MVSHPLFEHSKPGGLQGESSGSVSQVYAGRPPPRRPSSLRVLVLEASLRARCPECSPEACSSSPCSPSFLWVRAHHWLCSSSDEPRCPCRPVLAWTGLVLITQRMRVWHTRSAGRSPRLPRLCSAQGPLSQAPPAVGAVAMKTRRPRGIPARRAWDLGDIPSRGPWDPPSSVWWARPGPEPRSPQESVGFRLLSPMVWGSRPGVGLRCTEEADWFCSRPALLDIGPSQTPPPPPPRVQPGSCGHLLPGHLPSSCPPPALLPQTCEPGAAPAASEPATSHTRPVHSDHSTPSLPHPPSPGP